MTPVFNAESFLDETIASVVEQRGEIDVHYHVQDGGSTDGTLAILERWERRLDADDGRSKRGVHFSWSSRPDRGMYDAISRGFDTVLTRLAPADSDGAIMSWINADDVLATRALWTVLAFFRQHPEIEWLTGWNALMDESGALTGTARPTFRQSDIARGRHNGRDLPFIQQEGTFWRHRLWQQAGGLGPRSFRLAGDWDLWRRFARLTPLVTIDCCLAMHRRRVGQLSGDLSAYHKEIDTLPKEEVDVSAMHKSPLGAIYDCSNQRWNIIALHAPEQMLPPPQSDDRDNLGAKDLPPTLPSGRRWPRISVVTPSFNQGRFIAETIDSVLLQDYPDVEHIVIDGGSSDETLEVLDRYRHRLAYVVSERDKGQSDALNKGFARATGEILCWLNSDDRFAPGALRAVAIAFDTHDADIVSGVCEVYEGDKLLHRHISACEDGPLPMEVLMDLDRGWNTGQFFYQPEVFFTQELWARAGGHVRADCYYSMDYELWCRFAHVGARLHVIGAPLARFRVHPDQKTADPSKFKAELVGVRDAFALARGIELVTTRRPEARWDRVLRIALVNDIGLRYGAGIAQGRIAAGIEMAGHEPRLFELAEYRAPDGSADESALLEAVHAFAPDAVLFGNLHSATRNSVAVVDGLARHYPAFWVTHDFWYFTGRCAYPGSCAKYLVGCDDSCPTPTEYPELPSAQIAAAWAAKQALQSSTYAPVVLSNSRWSRSVAASAVGHERAGAATKVLPLRLGAPAAAYTRMPQDSARARFGIAADAFVLAFSVSSLSDERKGGHYLIEALNGIGLSGLVLLLIGNQDRSLKLDGIDVVSIGYVTDTYTLVAALSASDLYVGPSMAETLGQVFIEAALVGTASLGFDGSGVMDAIIDGVTGLRVARSVDALRTAIRTLHQDRARCKALGEWARIYARNEFPIEIGYRSLFNAWQATGLVDRWAVPNRIGFVRDSRFLPPPPGAMPWQPLSGIAPEEGPFPPELPEKLRWCMGPEAKIRIHAAREGASRFRMIYRNPLFGDLMLRVAVGGETAIEVLLLGTAGKSAATAEFALHLRSGWNQLSLVPDRWQTPSKREQRALAFMMIALEVEDAQPVRTVRDAN